MFILVEACNYHDTLFDTNQLSVVRGGSSLMKSVVEHVAQIADVSSDSEAELLFKPIATGASSGTFAYAGKNKDMTVNDLTQIIENELSNHEQFKHVSTIVTGVKLRNFSKARQIMLAEKSRMQQSALSMSIDSPSASNTRAVPCSLDGMRSAFDETGREFIGDESVVLSPKSQSRLKIGRKRRKSFFHEELSRINSVLDAESKIAFDTDSLPLANDLESLTRCSDYRLLNSKMAVVYLDGNRFGKLLAASASGKNADSGLKAFDRSVQQLRGELLKKIYFALVEPLEGRMQNAVASSDEGSDESAFLRFEALLWGGDEMTFVVPAWLGFEFVYFINSITKSWEIDSDSLTHAAGLILCNRKMPISVVHEKVSELVDERVKSADSNKYVSGNYLEYMIFESVDLPLDANIQSHFEDCYGVWASDRKPLRLDLDFYALREHLRELFQEGGLSVKQVHELAELVVNAESKEQLLLTASGREAYKDGLPPPPWLGEKTTRKERDAFSLFSKNELRAYQTCNIKDKSRVFSDVANMLCDDTSSLEGRVWFWLRLIELKNYIVVEPEG